MTATKVAAELIDQRLQEMKLVRAWLSQNVAILDASIAAMEVQSKTVTLLDMPLVNPVQWWLDMVTGNGNKK